MREVYRGVLSNTTDYRLKDREVTELQTTGRRLDMLISRFSLGILGLLPSSQHDLISGLFYKIADVMQVPPPLSCRACNIYIRVSYLPDNESTSILDVLDGEEGNILREIGNAASQVVVGVFHRNIDSSDICKCKY